MPRTPVRWRNRMLAVALVLMVVQGWGGAARAAILSDETVLLPVVGSRMCDEPVDATPFGVQMYSSTGRSSPYFTHLLDSGATWVRVPVRWQAAEPDYSDPPDYKWQAADTALAAAHDGCLNVIGTHVSAPQWAADVPNGPVRPEYLDELADYLGALVERYDGDGEQDAPGSPIVRFWEMYNEPDGIATWTGWAGAPERYAAMLQAVYPAIKAANPDAQVLFGGLGYDFWDDPVLPFDPRFLEKVVAAGGDKFDIMNFHYFPLAARNWSAQGPGLLQKTNAVRQEMERLDLNKPIVITETGHLAIVDPPLDNAELQMRYVPQLYTHAEAADVKVLIWFTLNDIENRPSFMGLVTATDPPVRRPAYAAYQFAAQELRALEYVRRLSDGETGAVDLEAHQFDDPIRGRSLVTAWLNPIETGDSKPLSLPADQVVVRSVFGDSTLVTDGQDGVIDGRVTIEVGGRPVYIEVE